MQQSVTHEFYRLKRIVTVRRRWTEMCRQRKLDGSDPQQKKQPKEEPKPQAKQDVLSYPYTSTCFELFITTRS